MKIVTIGELPQADFDDDMIDNCFYIKDPYSPVKSINMRKVFNKIKERAIKDGLTVELKGDKIMFMTGTV